MYKYAIHINLLECIEYSKLLTLIAHAHLTLKSDVRFPTIAQLLISNGTDKDIRVYDLGLKSTLPLTREHLVLLGTVYHQQLVHVAVNGINNIAKEVMLYDWNFDISNLKIELVNLIIEYNK
jgi:hypothetical protein